VSLRRAIELNGVAVEMNKQAFAWGRRYAADQVKVERSASPATPVVVQLPQSLDALVRRRAALLAKYQNDAYAKRFETYVEKVRAAEARLVSGDGLSKAVAKNLSKLMAYKDEYEVARLYTDGEFERRLAETFEGDVKVKFHLAPPLFAKRDAQGHLVKAQYGPWMKFAFGVLAKFKGLRGTVLDPVGRSEERKQERKLIADYEALIEQFAAALSNENYDTALALASLPERIRGFGHVKQKSIELASAQRDALLQRFHGGQAKVGIAA
jgi:indolepyruvate ferredoxin oxidoreductase